MPRSASTVTFNWMLHILKVHAVDRFYNASYISFEGNHHEIYDNLLTAVSNDRYDHAIFKTHTLPRHDALKLLNNQDHLTIFTIRNVIDSTKSLVGFFSNYEKDRSVIINLVVDQMQRCLTSLCENYDLLTIVYYDDIVSNPDTVLKDLINKTPFDVTTNTIEQCLEKYDLKNVMTMLEAMPASIDRYHCWHKTHLGADIAIKEDVLRDFDYMIEAISPQIKSVADSTGIDLLAL